MLSFKRANERNDRAMRTAFIHIGMPKTGSTAIQSACDRARHDLSAAGYHYLGGDRNHGERLSLAFWDKPDALHLAGLRWRDGTAALVYRDEVQAKLAEEIDATPQNLVVSGEDLSNFRATEVERLRRFLAKRFDRVQVIGYLREPLSWAISAAQQATKWSGDLLDDLFDAPRMPDYANRFGHWIAAFGADATDLRAYGGSDILTDFAAAIGLPRPLPPAPRLNESISNQTAILFSHANRIAPPFVDTRHNPLRSFDLTQVARVPGQAFTLPRETVEACFDTLAAERDWANTALGRAVFQDPGAPAVARDAWFGKERAALEELAVKCHEVTRAAQNERALKLTWKAHRHQEKPEVAKRLIDQAWLLTTDRWTMDMIARREFQSVARDHVHRPAISGEQ
ncbi:MAG: hypothetical protein AAFY31_18930, partial [Pseudomonadota bacterium]